MAESTEEKSKWQNQHNEIKMAESTSQNQHGRIKNGSIKWE